MALAPGTRIGVYDITAQIGEGGMGQVYRATDTKLKRQVAIKILPPSLAADHDRLARFQREAEVLASLNHQNIAGIYGVEQTDGAQALIMEIVEGEDLSAVIARGPVPLSDALPIARQIADALDAAHEQGVIHRDLKPANIKVRADGTVKVLDFGLAKALEPARAVASDLSHSPTITTPAMTAMGMILGTAAYMSPEQARGRPTDKRTDIWAFGVVLYEMLTGRRAFDGEDVTELIAAVVKTTPDWSALPSDTPIPIVTLIQRCLEKDRKGRIGDIAVAKFLLAEHATIGHASSIPAAAVSSQSPRGPLPWALAGAFLLTTLGLSFLHFREAPPRLPSIRFQVNAPGDAEISQFRLSPDGRRLAFVAASAGEPHLWVRSLDSIDAIPLSGTDGATYPFWSADGTEIGFFAQGKLKKIAVAGGLPVSLCDAVNARGGTWNRDGVILFTPNVVGGLHRVASTGGPSVAATTVTDPVGNDRFPEFLPDGRRFLFVRFASNDDGLYTGTLDAPAVARVLPDRSNAAYVPGPGRDGLLLFRRDNTLMAQPFDPERLQTTGGVVPVADAVSVAGNTGYGAFTSSHDGTIAYRSGVRGGNRQLVWLDRSGKRLSVVSKPDEINEPALSPDGKRVVSSIGDPTAGGADLWLQNLESGGMLSKLTFGLEVSSTPVWSPDSSDIAFSTASSPSGYRIQRLGAAAADRPEVLLQGPYVTILVSDWSQDGKFIVFSSRSEKTKDDLWLLPTTEDRKAVLFLQTPANERDGRLSPGGAWMAYRSDESGRNEIYVQHVPGNGSKFQISSAGGVAPRWSRDGKELFYLEGGRRLMAVPVTIGATFERGQARLLFEAPFVSDNMRFGGSVQPSADGQRFLALVRADDDSQPTGITVVTNWPFTQQK